MSAISVFHFFLLLLLVGGTIRFVEIRWPENPIVEALAVIY
jgi:hypothetical protein